MFRINDVIDGKYRVEGECSGTGGMGKVLFVESLKKPMPFRIVLKYSKDHTGEYLKRFRREVRLLASFSDNSRIVQVVDHNTDYDPPYFVMKYYAEGDLSSQSVYLRDNFSKQEKTFLQMIDCIQELHTRNEFHRDIKPQNFLLDGDQVVVSDFGLSTEIGSNTAFTRSSAYWGTPGYIPPEFLNGDFKHADAVGDVFMLGKTIYVLLTQRNPMYILNEGIPGPIFHIIERCCSTGKEQRYQTLADLRQSIVAAYDVLLARSGGVGKAKQLLIVINDHLEREQRYDISEITLFVEQLSLLDSIDQIRICTDISSLFFTVIGEQSVTLSLSPFLLIYERFVEGKNYDWYYAETIASNMKVIFSGNDVPIRQKAWALDLAIRGAYYMNRFAAMDACVAMIASVSDETLGFQVAPVLV